MISKGQFPNITNLTFKFFNVLTMSEITTAMQQTIFICYAWITKRRYYNNSLNLWFSWGLMIFAGFVILVKMWFCYNWIGTKNLLQVTNPNVSSVNSMCLKQVLQNKNKLKNNHCGRAAI